MRAAEAVHAGQIGKVQVLRTTARDNPVPSVSYLLTSHGFFHDSGVHDIDVMRWVLQEEPTEVYAVAHSHIDEIRAINDVDTVVMMFKFKSGVIGSIDLSRKAAYGYDQRVEVFGDKGMAQVENKPSTSAVISTSLGVLHDPVQHSFPQRFEEAYYLELDHFARIVLDGATPRISHTDSRNVFIIADCAKKSSISGLPVKIDYSIKE